MAEQTPVCNFGWKAPSFKLPGVDGKTYSLDELRGRNGTLVMFICNHCPYVKAVIDRLVRDVNELRSLGVNAVAISSNDVAHYPDIDLLARGPGYFHLDGTPYETSPNAGDR